MKYGKALKTALWGIAGLVVAFSFFKIPTFNYIFGYPLYALSLLMFVLACWQFYKENRK
jgi:FtsH-binding integral membrane protein